MSIRGPVFAKPLAALLSKTVEDAFARQGFASRELVTRWRDIAGSDIASHSEPIKIQWPRPSDGQAQEPATLVLRVEGPRALDIQHSSDVILERVNRFFGWNAIGRLAFRQAPLRRSDSPKVLSGPSEAAISDVATTLGAIEAEPLRDALARLGAAIKGN